MSSRINYYRFCLTCVARGLGQKHKKHASLAEKILLGDTNAPSFRHKGITGTGKH